MADVYSEDARRAVTAEGAAYFVRVDIPNDNATPDTTVTQGGQPDLVACSQFVVDCLGSAGLSGDGDDVVNVQVRVWGQLNSQVDYRPLLFDATGLPWSVLKLVDDLAGEAPNHEPIPPISANVDIVRSELGGPFDSDHALMVAINTRVAKNPVDPAL